MSHEASAGSLLGRMYFHGSDLLRRRAIMRLTLAAMVGSSILAPLILGAAYLAVGAAAAFDGSGPDDVTFQLLAAAGLAMVPAACLGGFAMHRGATQKSQASTLGWAVLGGMLFLGCATLCATCTSVRELGHIPEALVISAFVTAIGSVVSVPAGFGFGLLFLVGLSPVCGRLHAPAQNTPARAALASSAMLAVAAAIALIPTASIETSYAVFMARHLSAAIPTWTRFVVFVAPLALAALAFLALGFHERRLFVRTRKAIREGRHPEYYPGDIAPAEDAIPLTETDRKSATKRLLVRRDTSAYRGGEGAVSVYVGIA